MTFVNVRVCRIQLQSESVRIYNTSMHFAVIPVSLYRSKPKLFHDGLSHNPLVFRLVFPVQFAAIYVGATFKIGCCIRFDDVKDFGAERKCQRDANRKESVKNRMWVSAKSSGAEE